MAGWLMAKRLVARQTIVDGFENTPKVLMSTLMVLGGGGGGGKVISLKMAMVNNKKRMILTVKEVIY